MPAYQRIAAQAFGGPEVLRLEEVAGLPEPGPGEARLRVEAAGVGYTDTIVRRGRYVAYTGGLPLTPGYDVVGIVDALGPGVTVVRVGQRVTDMPVAGAYADYMIRPADALIPVPDGVAPEAAVEVPLMGVTAWQMLTRCVSLPTGATILVVGASGAVGRLLVQLANHLGLRVIGTASAAKQALITELGATALDYARDDLAEAILAVSGGVAAAFDAIGGASWETSWAALAPGGTLVGYGFQDFIESGAPSEVAAAAMRRFSVDLPAAGAEDGTGRTTTFYDIRTRREAHPQDYREDAAYLLELLASRRIVLQPAETLPLSQAAEAHRRVASGRLRHRLVLAPQLGETR